MILLLLLFGSVGAKNMTEASPNSAPLWISETATRSLSSVSGIPTFNSMTTSLTTNKVPEMGDNPGNQTFPLSSTPDTANVVSSPETSPAASRGSPVSESTVFQEDSTKKSTMPMKIPDGPSILGVSVTKTIGFPTMTGETMATSPLETTNGTSGTPVTMATSPLETSSGTSGTPVTMATSPLETSSGTSKLLLTMATSSLETSSGTSGTPVTMATSPLETTNGTNGTPVTMATSPLETSSGTSKLLLTMATSSLETSSGTSGTPVTMATSPLETTNGTNGTPVTMATSPLETSSGTSKLLLTMATSSLEISGGTSRSPVTKATSSLETSSGTREPLVTTASNSLKTISMTSGSPVIMKTSSPEISKGTSGLLVTTPATSLKTPMGTSGSPSLGVTISSPNISTNVSKRDKLIPAQGTKGTLLVAVLVALLVVIVLVALILLWRRRQKRKTGVLTLSRSGKRNGVVDAWAGVARVSDEEAMTATEGASGGNSDSNGPHREGSGQRPTLTTFFGRRKSRQGSVALEELKAGPASSLKGEEEPLVGNEDEGAEAPTSNGPEAKEVKTP